MRVETEISMTENGRAVKPTHGNSRQLTATLFFRPCFSTACGVQRAGNRPERKLKKVLALKSVALYVVLMSHGEAKILMGVRIPKSMMDAVQSAVAHDPEMSISSFFRNAVRAELERREHVTMENNHAAKNAEVPRILLSGRRSRSIVRFAENNSAVGH